VVDWVTWSEGWPPPQSCLLLCGAESVQKLRGAQSPLSRIDEDSSHSSLSLELDRTALHHVTQDDFGLEQQIFESLPGHIVSPASQDDLPVVEVFLARLRDIVPQQHSRVLARATPNQGEFEAILAAVLLDVEDWFDHCSIG
jgi:hypothetical protein